MGLTVRHSTELIKTAVSPRMPVPTAEKVFMPPAMMILLSFSSIRYRIIHSIRKYINALINSINNRDQKIKIPKKWLKFLKVPRQISARQRLAMRSIRFNSFCDIVESFIHISPFWLLGFGNHQSSLLTKLNSNKEHGFWWHRDVCIWVFTCSITCCSRSCHNACVHE